MISPILTGLFAGWTAVQIAVGFFFIQAYSARRRELEYLLFGFVCLAISVTDAGFTLAGTLSDPSQWPLTQKITHTGAFLSTAFNFHFVLQFVRPRTVPRLVPAMYVLAVAYCALMLLGGWWVPGTLRTVHSSLFGIAMEDVRAQPRLIGVSGYAVMMLADAWALHVLIAAYRSGRREVFGAVVGLVIVVACGANDVFTILNQLATPPLFTYGFLIYGFGVADTLLVRYRRAAEELEVTANELRQTTEELTGSYLELSSVQEELFRKRQLASVGELAASIAHEVRNPLAVIVNAAANLKRTNLVADNRNMLFTIIEEEITRLNNIVTELLRYARPVNIQREEVVLSDVIKSLNEAVGVDHALKLEAPKEPEVEKVWADPTLLRLALQNVVDNARQSMPNGGPIVVSVERAKLGDAAGVRIEIVDSGQGMDTRTLQRAMDPFFSTRPSGTGLGLPITGRIVEAHGGRVDLQSRIGEGTKVALFIPGKRTDGRLSGPRLTPEPRA